MSWDSYVNLLTASGLVSKAVIFGHDGRVWAASASLQIPQNELQFLVKAFGDASQAQSEGIKLLGESYILLRSTNESIYAKRGDVGFSAAKTKQGVVLGFYDKRTPAGRSTLEVEKTADYLRTCDL